MGSYLCLGLATFVLCSLSSAAIEGDVPLYQPAPDWESVTRTASGLYQANGLISEGGGLTAGADLIAATYSDPKAAIAAANMALELDPISSVATSVLYEIFALNGDSNKALATIASAEEYGVDQDYVALARSNAFSLLGRHDDAIEILDTKIAAQPNDPDYLNGLCWAKGLGNQLLESALKECTKAIQLAESPSEILDSRALVFFLPLSKDTRSLDLDCSKGDEC